MESQDVIQRNYESFLGRAQQLSQGMINTKTASIMKLKNYGIATVFFQKQLKIDDVTDELENKFSVNILYALRNTNKKDFKVLAYSMPYDDQMYVIQLESYMYGIIRQMTVTFYKSLDIMFEQIRSKYLALEDTDWQILEMEEDGKFFHNFEGKNNEHA